MTDNVKLFVMSGNNFRFMAVVLKMKKEKDKKRISGFFSSFSCFQNYSD